ncbi:hypothetical protein GQ457_15G010050 [Hibiscus cannabinus]
MRPGLSSWRSTSTSLMSFTFFVSLGDLNPTMKEVDVIFQALVLCVGEKDQVFAIKSSLGVTYLLNIPKLMMFHSDPHSMIARKVFNSTQSNARLSAPKML